MEPDSIFVQGVGDTVHHVLRETVVVLKDDAWFGRAAQLITWLIAAIVGAGAVFLRRGLEIRDQRRIIRMIILDEMVSLLPLFDVARERVANRQALSQTVHLGLDANMARFERGSDYIVHLKPMKRSSAVSAWFRDSRMLWNGLRRYTVGNEQLYEYLTDASMPPATVTALDVHILKGDRLLLSFGYNRHAHELAAGIRRPEAPGPSAG